MAGSRIVWLVVLVLFGVACADTSKLESKVDELEFRVLTLEAIEQGETDPQPLSLSGNVVLGTLKNYRIVDGIECTGAGEDFRQVAEDAPIAAKDADGRRVAIDGLAPGRLENTDGDDECRFRFSLRGLPTELDYYDIAVAGKSWRFYKSEIEGNGGRARLVVDGAT